MSVDDIFNCIRINDRTVTAGQPTEQQLEDVKREGFDTVINLATIDPRYSLEDEALQCHRLGMSYHHIPVAWEEPVESDYRAFETVMKDCTGARVFIHCAANYRVTLFYSAYAQHHLGWTADQAQELRERIWNSNPEYTMDGVWSAFLEIINGRLKG